MFGGVGRAIDGSPLNMQTPDQHKGRVTYGSGPALAGEYGFFYSMESVGGKVKVLDHGVLRNGLVEERGHGLMKWQGLLAELVKGGRRITVKICMWSDRSRTPGLEKLSSWETSFGIFWHR